MRAAKLTEGAEPPPNRPMAGGICVGARRCAAGRVTAERLEAKHLANPADRSGSGQLAENRDANRV